MTELRKSINAILYQRVTSPLFGTLFISWIVWNWKIIYTTFFINEDKIDKNKIDYIVENFSDTSSLIWYPLLSTLILITLIPFISNGAFWLSLNFEKWRVNSKNKIEKKQLLTLEQSLQLRQQLLDYERKFESLLNQKDTEIKELKLIIDNSKKEENSISENIEFGSKDDYTERSAIELFNKIKENEILKNSLIEISEYLQKGLTDLSLNQDINQKSISYFEANNLIDTEGRGSYFWTPKGKRVLQLLLDSDFE